MVSALIAILLASVGAVASASSNSTVRHLESAFCFSGHNIDFPGNDFDNAQASVPDKCLAECAKRSRCNGYTWTNYNGGTCWLKTSFQAGVVNVGAESCYLGDIGAWMGAKFADCDMPGNDLESVAAPADVCRLACSARSNCRAVTSYGGVCYFKKDVRECVAKKGAESTIVLNRRVSI